MKSIVALLAGFITVFIPSILTDMALEATGLMRLDTTFQNPIWVLALAIVCRALYFTVGGYITARLAPKAPMRHAIILGVIGTLLGVGGAVMTWGTAPNWVPIAFVLLPFPSSLIGGKLRTSAIEPVKNS
jgi:MFS family permease